MSIMVTLHTPLDKPFRINPGDMIYLLPPHTPAIDIHSKAGTPVVVLRVYSSQFIPSNDPYWLTWQYELKVNKSMSRHMEHWLAYLPGEDRAVAKGLPPPHFYELD